MPSLNEIRSPFLDYFAARRITPSSPRRRWCRRTIRPCCSSTPAWCSSRTSSPAPRRRPAPRAASSQKCVRAGGKHNDLDNVGYTARHHTFFEMLGNFSFGDYFKDDAIELRLGAAHQGVRAARRQAAGHRLRRRRRGPACGRRSPACPTSEIIRIATADNFWSMGDTGPCGPCTEIFYDHGAHIPGGPPGSPDEDGDRFVEIWNLVFMQFEQLADGDAHATCRSPRSTPAWAWSASPPCCRACTPTTTSTCSATLIAASRELAGGAGGEAERPLAPGDRRPPALVQLPDRRRRDAVQRGPRLRAAPDHAPRHAPRPPAGRGRAADAPPGADAGRSRWATPIRS